MRKKDESKEITDTIMEICDEEIEIEGLHSYNDPQVHLSNRCHKRLLKYIREEFFFICPMCSQFFRNNLTQCPNCKTHVGSINWIYAEKELK